MMTSSSSGTLIKRVGHEKAFEMFHEAGLDAMDFPVDGGVKDREALKNCAVYGLSEEQITEKFSAIGELAKKHGVTIGQTHSMFGYSKAIDPLDEELMKEYTEVTIGDIVATRAIGGDVTVVHPMRLIGQLMDRVDECFDVNYRFYSALRPACEKYNVKVAIENTLTLDADGNIRAHQYSDPREIVRLVKALGTDCFCTCCDTGHFALTEKDTNFTVGDCIRVFGDTLGVVHIQEVDRIDDRHQVPYTYANVMDWDDIYKALAEVGFKGPANLEVMPHLAKYPDCPEMNFEAIRHIGAISRYVASQIESARG